MSREIKFRAWDKDRGEMIPASELCFHEYVSVEDHFMDEDKLFMQFTGLLDKNGVEVYEDDVFEAPHDFGPAGFKTRKGVVKFCKLDGYQWEYWDLSKLEIIGNIHEHPELLEQK